MHICGEGQKKRLCDAPGVDEAARNGLIELFMEGWAGNCSGKTTVAITACGVGQGLQNICGAVPCRVKSCRLFPERQHCIPLFSVIYFVSARGTA